MYIIIYLNKYIFMLIIFFLFFLQNKNIIFLNNIYIYILIKKNNETNDKYIFI